MTTLALPETVLALFGPAGPEFEAWLAHALTNQAEEARADVAERELALTGRLDRFESVLGVARHDLDQLRVDVNQLRVDVNQLRVDVNQLRVDVNQLRVDVNQLRVDVSLLRDEVQHLRESVAEMRGELVMMRATMTEVHLDLRALGARVDRSTQWTTGVLSVFGAMVTLLLAIQMLQQ